MVFYLYSYKDTAFCIYLQFICHEIFAFIKSDL